jgi:single-strand DNA-binding protein
MALTSSLTVSGNLTRDPEIRYTQSGKPVVNFTVATTPSQFNRDTQKWEDGETLFTNCSAWDNMAEHIGHSLSKGDKVIVYGVLKSRTYQANDGTTKTATELQVDDCGPSLKYANAKPEKGDHAKGPDRVSSTADGWTTVDDSDVPF